MRKQFRKVTEKVRAASRVLTWDGEIKAWRNVSVRIYLKPALGIDDIFTPRPNFKFATIEIIQELPNLNTHRFHGDLCKISENNSPMRSSTVRPKCEKISEKIPKIFAHPQGYYLEMEISRHDETWASGFIKNRRPELTTFFHQDRILNSLRSR